MDENKLKVLKEIGYKIFPSCKFCKYSNLRGDWGTCNITTYSHLKHTGDKRQLSINANGGCTKFKWKDTTEIHGFNELRASDSKSL